MTVNKTRFKSHQINLDEKPWVAEIGTDRYASPDDTSEATGYAPRPEFEPTRDPYPYESTLDGSRWAAAGGLCWPDYDPEDAHEWSNVLRWAPRREHFDTPVNRVLVLFRRDAEHNGIKSALEYDWPTNSVASSPDEIEHARKVLDRLAGWLA